MPDPDWYLIASDAGKISIYVFGEIPANAEDCFADIRDIPTPAEADVFVNCLGGHPYSALGIANTLQSWRAKGTRVRCEVAGVCGSAATLISSAADEVAVSAEGFFLIHRARYTDGSEEDDRLAGMNECMIRRLAAKTGRGKDKIRELVASESWLNAQTAADLGFADEIVGENERGLANV